MELFKFKSKNDGVDKEHIFRTSFMAREEIRRFSEEKASSLNVGDYGELMIELQQVQEELKLAEKMKDSKKKKNLEVELTERIKELMSRMLPYVQEMESAEATALEIAKICLFYSKEHRGVVDDKLFEDIMFDMEDEYGHVRMAEILEEAKDRVFTEIKEENEVTAKIKEKKNQTLPKS